jgi:hypothetical protein
MSAFTWRDWSSLVPYRSLLVAAAALALGGCCPRLTLPVPEGPTKDQKGPELHTYRFSFGPDGTSPCVIKSAGVTTSRLDGKPDKTLRDRTCSGDLNCARASKKNGDKIRFVSEPAGHKFVVVFDPFKPSTFASDEDFKIDGALTIPTGKVYSFSVVATAEACTPLDPRMIIDP